MNGECYIKNYIKEMNNDKNIRLLIKNLLSKIKLIINSDLNLEDEHIKRSLLDMLDDVDYLTKINLKTLNDSENIDTMLDVLIYTKKVRDVLN